ncbi:protein-associating with the carboxyl-terminal domain of ezrin isoform X1 [Podarcis raffonei]|uniref:protein-associating with the carboxyl-terminal domain of ezrin isoform X1 n=2 Tax=Podarcis raffonei TaxID=65483 RepID=UPI002329186D|nr:protein-associating with the carboxyl-terminal domain of ezrin isoform X1 [Podarcis raffonei]XP_053247339.1 protein-associating with the carboxyl-terminal domain of ezrin isoform X1 [Podarcis raffonei]
MGSENSALKRDALQEPPFTLPSGVNIYPAVLQRGKLASVFVYKRENEDNVNKAAKHLKTLRHPCLLRFLSCTVETDGIHLVTERVQPLEKVLETLSSPEICAGIYDVLQALVFLHDRGHLTHNNVCLSSVFVSEDGHWKLGGMETVCNQNEATAEFLHSIKSIREKTGIPPEELSDDFQLLPDGQGHSRDAYSFGVMVENLLTFLNEEVSEDVISSFHHTLRSSLLNPDFMGRSPLSSLLLHEFFRNDFLEVVSFLNSLTLKTEEEKTEFFKFLLDRVAGLSEKLIALRLVPLLLNPLVFAEPVAVKSFLPHLLGPRKDKVGESQINGLLSPAVFQAHVSPVLLKLFEVHEEHVRMVLLSHLDAYAELFTQKELKNVILPQVLLGLRDTSDSLVAATLQSLGVLVSLLGPEVVVGGDRTKIFKSSAPSFTKTTDLSPEDSPNHVVSCQRRLIYQPLQKNNSMFLKCPSSGNLPFSSRNHVPRQDSHVALREGEQDSLHLSSVPGGLNILRNGGNYQHAVEKIGEEWPDWSEGEKPEADKSVESQRKEFCVNSSPCLAGHDVDGKSWDGAADSPNFKLSSGNSLTAVGLNDVAELQLPPAMFELRKEFRTLKCNPSPGPSINSGSYGHRDHQQDEIGLPKAALLEKPPKLECGLGEEYMIQVKRKELHDTELDWFADMVPDIKPPSALLILPELGPHPVIQNNLNTVSGSKCDAQFSSKFAAAEITEVDVGWEQDELNWEDDANW